MWEISGGGAYDTIHSRSSILVDWLASVTHPPTHFQTMVKLSVVREISCVKGTASPESTILTVCT